jgi:two-component system OmpR family sensor kinase/two-component system sensor histidine kinase BaeS
VNLKKHRKHHGRWDHDEHPPWPRWPHDHEPFHRPPGWRRGRGLLFLRFAGVFGFIALLVLGGMGTLAFLLSRLFGGGGRAAVLTWVGGCGLSLALPLLAAALARRAFQDIATPLADVMSAADAVAEGDLSVRVPARGPHEFGRLARSFNRMIAELERSDQQRRNLTADVAHELRTPLHIIQGNLEGVLDGVYEPTTDHICATLEETRLLTRLVEDLRTLSLAEAGQLVLVQEQVDVAELLADVGTSFSGQAEAAGIDLRVEIEGEPSDLTIIGDAGRLDQVLGNLMANAVRYTHSGGSITLRAEPLDDSVRIILRDTGEGIPAEDVPYVFDRFWRGDRSRSHAGGAGSGLGLAIARQLVQAHGGRIEVESAVGQGTTFTIELPG